MTVLKRQKCPGCLPNEAGAIFKEDYTDYEGTDEPGTGEWSTRNVCQNCGYAKPIARRTRYNPFNCEPEHAEKLNRFDLAKFHAFNPGGILAHWNELSDRIQMAIDAGIVKGGFWLVYGPTGYHYNKLLELASKKQFKVWDLTYTLNEITKTIETAQSELDHHEAQAAHTKGN